MKLSRAAAEIADAAPGPSPAVIAASVRRPAHLQAAEFEFAALRTERAEVLAATQAAIAGKTDLDGGAAKREIAALVARRLKIEAATDALRRKITPARVAHGAAVERALGPVHMAAARRCLAAILEVRNAASVLAECAEAARNAGAGTLTDMGSLGGYGGFNDLNMLEAATRAICGGDEQ
jgi:hypothetical protein